MELTFEKIGDWYISEFEVTSDFNLHIEKEPKGDFYLYQRTSSSGQYDIIQDFGYKKGGDNVIDLDFQALVYPKWIKIKSAVIPTVATISTDGEVREVSYQAKEIEITSNGTTKVTADTGYTALGSVNVKVNVPTEGGGESGSTMVYLDWTNISNSDRLGLNPYIFAVKGVAQGMTGIFTLPLYTSMQGQSSDIKAVAIDLSFELAVKTEEGSQTISIEQNLIEVGVNLSAITRITKEEFYNLNA